MKKFLLLTFLTLIPVAAVAAPNNSYYRLSSSQRASVDRMCSHRDGIQYDECRSTIADLIVRANPSFNPTLHYPSPQILQR